MLAPVAPFDHCTVPSQFLAVSVTLPPSHITSLSAEIDGARQSGLLFGTPIVTVVEEQTVGLALSQI